ncbi:MAG: hypothetical protein EKK69_03645 [Candidatus Competibacteraceae bacterium]|nr:MAG: hypothetical protein EKK69_03645 [Candidatus Competibacteraceae bacterium]
MFPGDQPFDVLRFYNRVGISTLLGMGSVLVLIPSNFDECCAVMPALPPIPPAVPPPLSASPEQLIEERREQERLLRMIDALILAYRQPVVTVIMERNLK